MVWERVGADGASMTSMLAFVCTGPSEGFDPLCNPSHTVVLLTGVVLAFSGAVAMIVVVARRGGRRRPGPPGHPGHPG